MKKFIKYIFVMLAVLLPGFAVSGAEAEPQSPAVAEETHSDEGKVNPKEIIFEHLGDAYGWEVPFDHHHRIPLPIIVKAKDGGFRCFMSSRIQHGEEYNAGGAVFTIAKFGSPYQGKVVEIVDGEEYRPLDISITKNVAALFITVVLV